MYYNTTHEEEQKVIQFVDLTEAQDELVLAIYRCRPTIAMSPSVIYDRIVRHCKKIEKTPPPLTSIRRSITDLTNEGKLRKTNVKSVGLYGRLEYNWMFNPGPTENAEDPFTNP